MDIDGSLHSQRSVKSGDNAILNLSVVVITKNEESNLPRFFASIPKVGEIVLVDSGSADETVKIAQDNGAKIVVHPFSSYALQKNVAIKNATKDWVLSLDADEVISTSLWNEIAKRCDDIGEINSGFFLRRRLVFMGKKLAFGRSSDWTLRLARRATASFEGKIHEKMQVDGTVDYLSAGHVEHYSYKNITDYFVRFNNYTDTIAANKSGPRNPLTKFVIGLRFWAEFISRYFVHGGFLDGFAGYTYALYSSVYAFTKYSKAIERSQSDKE